MELAFCLELYVDRVDIPATDDALPKDSICGIRVDLRVKIQDINLEIPERWKQMSDISADMQFHKGILRVNESEKVFMSLPDIGIVRPAADL